MGVSNQTTALQPHSMQLAVLQLTAATMLFYHPLVQQARAWSVEVRQTDCNASCFAEMPA
jgi:hypothetical protein